METVVAGTARKVLATKLRRIVSMPQVLEEADNEGETAWQALDPGVLNHYVKPFDKLELE